MSNHLKYQTSPYLLQHSTNPVDWYPWCDEAFQKAKAEDKPIFLSIGYSTCHWCHVMAHESFEDKETAQLLNRYYVSIKVDKEERPDIDSLYMAVCQALTGSGGWPTSVFMTPEQRPFYAGTYFPRTSRYGAIGFQDLLLAIHENWEKDRSGLLRSADEITEVLSRKETEYSETDTGLINSAVSAYKSSYDKEFGGFGQAPKFPAPHNLLFLMTYYEKSGDRSTLEMAEKTLLQMYRGGLFDHIGYGFCRYSTDRYFLVPHFEKMLYDNALLISAYCRAFRITKNLFYQDVAEKTASYILREMTSREGGFFSAQDADSQGEEGKYYVFEPSEIIRLLGKKNGEKFNALFDIKDSGNFGKKSIPNLLQSEASGMAFDACLSSVYDYRRERGNLHLDDKILTSWNSLMIAAMCQLYRAGRNTEYLNAAKKAQLFIEEKLCQGDTLFVSFRVGKHGEKGFLDDYANYIFALMALYDATLDTAYLKKAQCFCKKVLADFYDEKQGGFYLSGRDSEALIMRPKETFDGAMPSGNSMMAYDLVRLYYLTDSEDMKEILETQLRFLSAQAQRYPTGYAMFLMALSDYFEPPQKITVVPKEKNDLSELPFIVSPESIVRVMNKPTDEYPLKDGKTTFYVCQNHSCMPPVNDLRSIK